MSREFRPLPTNRVEAFSDGVYAIAITLLVLDLGVPGSAEPLLAGLRQEWPSFLGFLVSFVFIGASWVSHVKLTRSMSMCDDVFVGLNLLKLLSVSLLPFSTSLMANHLTDAGQRPAAVLFGVNMTFAGAATVVLAGYASRTEGLMRPGEGPELRRLFRTQCAFTALFGLATAVGAFVPTFAVFDYLFLAALMLFRPFVRLGRKISGHGGPQPRRRIPPSSSV